MIAEKHEPGHFYSVIPNITKDYNNNKLKFINLDFNENSHIEILEDLKYSLNEFNKKFSYGTDLNTSQEKFQFILNNGAFGHMDARLLHYFLKKNNPKKIIEIGSGNSTLLMYNTKQMFNLDFEIICIEPYPKNYLKEMHNKNLITLIEDKLENIDLSLFKSLEENDILFIDSSHVLKLDSDVMYYFVNIFPLLNKGVLIHIHDIFFPYDYPINWIKDGIFWNEQYVLYMFLQYNTKFKIKFCNSYAGFKYHKELKEIQKNSYEVINNLVNYVFSGGSIWLTVCN